MNIRSICTAFLVMFLVSGAVVMQADDDKGNQSPNGQQLFDTQLVRVADLNTPAGNPAGQQLGPFFGPNGTDPLDDGRVQVLRNRKAQFELRGATPNVTYNAFFCRFGFLAAPGCFMLVGQLDTNVEGNAEGLLSFPANPAAASDTWAGTFILTRIVGGAATNEYVAGFTFPPLPPTDGTGADVDVSGRIMSMDKTNSSFRLAELPTDIFTGAATQFEKIDGFSDLAVGMDVEVKGFTKPDGTIFATNVKSDENGKSHKQDDN
jgi:hypothetical protein